MKKTCIAKQEEKITLNVNSCYLMGGNRVDWLFFFIFLHLSVFSMLIMYYFKIGQSFYKLKCKEKKRLHAKIDLPLCLSINIVYREV